MTTQALFRDDAYLRSCTAHVTTVAPGVVQLNRTVFYPLGGGQPGDTGRLMTPDGQVIPVLDTRKGEQPGDIWHIIAEDAPLPSPGSEIKAEIDWNRRYRHMRIHTCLHLLSAIIKGEITGAQIGDGKGRVDFNLPDQPLNKDDVASTLDRLIGEAHRVGARWISDEELLAQPNLIRTLSVKPPMGTGSVRLLEIDGIDLQPCGGTHVANTAEIGKILIPKIENKGRQNRRIHVTLADVS